MNFRRLRNSIESLQVKIVLIAVLISLISFGTASFFSIRWMAEEMEDDYRQKANLIGMHIIHDIGLTMLSMGHEGIADVLNIYRKYMDVEAIRFYNSRGEEVFSEEKGPPEEKVEETLRSGESLHFQTMVNDREVANFIFPVKDEPSCRQCHEKNEPTMGALLLSLHRGQLESYIRQLKKRFLYLFSLLALVICGVTVLGVNLIFIRPLLRIKEGAEAIEKSVFTQKIPVKSRDEVGILAETFNRMAEALSHKDRALAEQVRLASRSQKEWQKTVNCISDPIVVIDRDCNFIKANRAFQEVFKEYFPLSTDPSDRKCSDLFETCLRPNCPHLASLQERRPVTAQVRGHRSGKLFEIAIFPYDSPEGERVGSVAIFKDITEKQESDLRMIMNERLATLGQMASGIAHEINNPLATISIATEGMLKRIKEERFEPRLFGNYLFMIKEEIQRVMNISRNMLSFVRKKTEEKKPVLINQLLDRTLEAAKFQDRFKDVSVLRLYQEELPAVAAYEGELRQVFLSILINASEAMEDRGRLTLETGTEDRKVFVKISDTGPGIPSDIRNRIFDPFFTTKTKEGGTGLGLSIADKIIRENNGKIEVASEEGKGTTFKITLPLGPA